jgi:DnaJ-class molecular chaperone
LASQHHPDKGGDKNKFQEIEEAYRTLGDPQKRAEYNNPRSNAHNFGFHNQAGPGGFDFQSIFDVFDEQRIGSQVCRIMQHIVLFDEYRGKGLLPDEKSLAFRITMQDTQSTLQDDSIDAALGAFIDVVNKKLGATLRK